MIRSCLRRLRRVLDGLHGMFLLFDPEREELVYASPGLWDLLGFSRKRFPLHWKRLAGFIHPEDRGHLEAEDIRVVAPRDFCFRIINTKREVKWIQAEVVPIPCRNGRTSLLAVRISDITERVKRDADLKRLTTKALYAQEDERMRIARDLHDSVAQNLSALTLNLEAALVDQNNTLSPAGRELLRHAITSARECMAETRRIVMGLRPTHLDDLGLSAAINYLVRECVNDLDGDVMISNDTSLDDKNLDDTRKIVLFRVLQEALNNIRRNSDADEIDISLQEKGGEILLTIRDNGSGFDPRESPASLGLDTMRERLELVSGYLLVREMDRGGMEIHAVMPAKQSEVDH